MTSIENEIVKTLKIDEPINSVTLVVESVEDKNTDIKLNYQIESYHITAGELFLYIKKDSLVKIDKVIKNKDIHQINMDLKNESST